MCKAARGTTADKPVSKPGFSPGASSGGLTYRTGREGGAEKRRGQRRTGGREEEGAEAEGKSTSGQRQRPDSPERNPVCSIRSRNAEPTPERERGQVSQDTGDRRRGQGRSAESHGPHGAFLATVQLTRSSAPGTTS